jgi:hypothetical protein
MYVCMSVNVSTEVCQLLYTGIMYCKDACDQCTKANMLVINCYDVVATLTLVLFVTSTSTAR